MKKKKRSDHEAQAKQISAREGHCYPIDRCPKDACHCGKKKETTTEQLGGRKGWIDAASAAIFVSILALGVTTWQGYIAYKTMTNSLRAYLYVQGVELKCPRCEKPDTLTPDKLFAQPLPNKAVPFPRGAWIDVVFENGGETPAYDIDENVTVKELMDQPTLANNSYAPAQLPSDFDFEEYVDPAVPAHPVVAKGQPMMVEEPISPFQVLRARQFAAPFPGMSSEQGKRSIIFVYGHVSYTDIFSKRRRTNFCVRFDPATDWNPTESFGACDSHNDQN